MDLTRTRNGRRILFCLLYFSEGAPIGFIWWTLPSRLRLSGFPIESITRLTAAATLMWTIKPLWAPALDLMRTSKWTMRSWILTTQVGMALSLLPLLFTGLGSPTVSLLPFLVLHAFFAATQDVAVDAYCISITPEHERGTLNGIMQIGMTCGRMLFGSLILIYAPGLPDAYLVLLLVWAIVSVALLTWIGTPHTHEIRDATPLARRLVSAFSGRNFWIGLLFAASAGAAFEVTGALVRPFLVDIGLKESQVMSATLAQGMAMMIGAAIGGRLSDLVDRRKACAAGVIIIAGIVLIISQFMQQQVTVTIMLQTLVALYLVIGAFTAISYALFMDLTHPSLAATQFSAFMGGTNLCESWSAYAGGRLTSSAQQVYPQQPSHPTPPPQAMAAGYAYTLMIFAFISLASLPLLGFLKPRPRQQEEPG